MTAFLTVDVGNSQICTVVYDNAQILASRRLETRPFLTTDQLLVEWRTVLSDLDLTPSQTHLSICSSVPDYRPILQEAARALAALTFYWVSADSPHQLNLTPGIRSEIGADLIAGLVGARDKAQGPLVVVDCGTVTTLTLLSGSDEVLGAAFLPGIRTQLRSLMVSAPHLAHSMALSLPEQPFGCNTIEALQSGVLYGHAGSIESFVSHYRDLFAHEALSAFGCGGLFGSIAALCPSVGHVDSTLVNDGCRLLSLRQLQEGV